MKLFLVLSSCAFVNVLAYKDESQRQSQVELTNRYIETFYIGIKPLNFDNKFRYFLWFFSRFTYRYLLILDRLLPLIEKTVLENKYTMVEMSYIWTVPEHAKTLKPEQSILHIFKAQSVRDPELPVPVEYQIDGDTCLSDLGIERRNTTRKAFNTLINRILDGDNREFKDFPPACRSIGLYSSINHPDSFITSAEVDEIGTCVLTDTENDIIRYRSIDGCIFQVDANNVRIQKLSAQVNYLLL